MAINSIIHTNQHSIERVLATGLPLVLGFWQREQPIPAAIEASLQQFAAQNGGKALVALVDAGAERELVGRYQVEQTPALVFIKQKQVETVLHGRLEEQAIQAWLNYLVQGSARPAAAASRAPLTPTSGASGKPIVLTDANFQQIVSGPGPVLVDFWAPWCGPCRMIAPAIEQLAAEFQGRALVGKLNVDENPQTRARYQIMGIPALYIFKNGKVVDELAGAQPFQVLKQRLSWQVGK